MRYRPVTLRSHGSPSARPLPASRIPECTTPARAIPRTERQGAQAGPLPLAGASCDSRQCRGARTRVAGCDDVVIVASLPARRLLALGAGGTRRPPLAPPLWAARWRLITRPAPWQVE